MQNNGVKPENNEKNVFISIFLGPVHGKCKMLVSVDIANWDVRLGTIKSSGVMLHWDTKYPQKF